METEVSSTTADQQHRDRLHSKTDSTSHSSPTTTKNGSTMLNKKEQDLRDRSPSPSSTTSITPTATSSTRFDYKNSPYQVPPDLDGPELADLDFEEDDDAFHQVDLTDSPGGHSRNNSVEIGLEQGTSVNADSSTTANSHANRLTAKDEDYEAQLGGPAKELVVQDVIDSDFPDIARLGILQVAGDDKIGRKVIIFSACRLPRSDMIDHERLLNYVTRTLEQYVANDYCVLYLHYGLTSANRPSWNWLLQAYRTLNRELHYGQSQMNENITSLVQLRAQFHHSKFSQKINYVRNLCDVGCIFFLDQLPIPTRVINYNASLTTVAQRSGSNRVTFSGFNDSGPSYSANAAVMDSTVYLQDTIDDVTPDPTQQFGVSLQHIFMNDPNRTIPIVVEDVVDYLREKGMTVEFIFRRSVSRSRLEEIQALYNKGESVDLTEYNDPYLAAALLKAFLRNLREPLLTFELYDNILTVNSLSGNEKIRTVMQMMVEKLPRENYNLLKYLIHFLTEVITYAEKNHMNATGLSIIFGPNLVWSRYHASLTTQGVINAFVQLLITHFESIFIR